MSIKKIGYVLMKDTRLQLEPGEARLGLEPVPNRSFDTWTR